jgi:hypothetical protein
MRMKDTGTAFGRCLRFFAPFPTRKLHLSLMSDPDSDFSSSCCLCRPKSRAVREFHTQKTLAVPWTKISTLQVSSKVTALRSDRITLGCESPVHIE